MLQQMWKESDVKTNFQHPNLSVTMEVVQLSDGRSITDWPIAKTQDYVNTFVVIEDGLALVLEGYRHRLGRSSWQMLGSYLRSGEDPAEIASRMLLDVAGYRVNSWRHLATLVTDSDQNNGVGHFFLGRNVQLVRPPKPDANVLYEVKWVRLGELKRGLWDGRIAGASYATTVAMGMLALGCY